MGEQTWDDWKKSMEMQLEIKHQANIERLAALSNDVKCLATEMRIFQRKWESTLQETKNSRQEAKDLRRAVLEKGLTGIVWAVIVFCAIASWTYIKEHIK